jgi:hypothetical protein
MCCDPLVLRIDAWLDAVLSKNLMTATFLLLLYGGVAASIVAIATKF